MKQNNKIEFHIPLIMSVAMLLAMSVPTLQMPYCYSEAQLMGDSIMYIQNHGLGAVFSGDDVMLPDLFSVMMAYISKFISISPIVTHAITMLFSAISIMMAYKFGKFFFSIQAGVMSAAIMCAQNVFIAQTGLVLPIMMLNCCILGGVYMFYREKYLWCTLLMCVATLIDITGFITSTFILIAYFKMKYREWTISQNIMLTIPIVLWFGYQILSLTICAKMTTRPLDFGWENFADNAKFIFVDQYRFVISAILLIILIINIINKDMQYFVKDMAYNSTLLFALLFLGNSILGHNQSWNLPAISIMSIFVGCTISTLHVSYYVKYMIACVLIMTSAVSALHHNNVTDSHVNYKSKIKVDAKTVKLISENANDNEMIFCDRYFKRFLTVKELGYIDTYRNYDCASSDSSQISYSKWAIYSNFEEQESLKNIQTNSNYEKRSTIYINDCVNEIYQRK